MRTLPAILLGIVAYTIFLVASVPASFVSERIAAQSQGRVAFEGVAGTAWNGSASFALRLPAALVRIERLVWHFRPSQLFAGRLAFLVDASDGTLVGQGEVARSLGAWHIVQARATGDASAMQRYVALASAWQPSGIVAVEIPSLTFDGAKLNGSASAEWRAASLSLSEVKPLGSWRAVLDAQDGPARVVVTTIDGPLRISGNGTLAIPGTLIFSGEARADPAQEKAMEPILKLFGARRADGAWPIESR